MARAEIHNLKDEETLELAAVGTPFTEETGIIEVVLSERNLLSLLSKLYIDGSRRTLYNSDVPSGYLLKLVAEDDTAHYEGRSGAGAMHPDTEELIDLLQAVIEEWQQKRKIVTLFQKGVKEARGV